MDDSSEAWPQRRSGQKTVAEIPGITELRLLPGGILLAVVTAPARA